jgi:hypothetical protein
MCATFESAASYIALLLRRMSPILADSVAKVAAEIAWLASGQEQPSGKFHHIKYAIFRLSKPKDSASVAGKEHFRLLLGKSETA